MSDIEEETPPVSTSQNTTAASAAHYVVQHPTHGPKDIRMHAFVADSDPDETGRRWKKWKNELLTRFRYFRISSTQDRVDALHIYGGEQIRELIESLESVTTPPSADNLNEYEKIITKLDNHFIPMVNPDCARSKLEKMCQNEGESVAQYHVRLRLQIAKCAFTDPDDVIRSKILQTMRDKKLRREAMVQRYTLQKLLEHAANKEDIDRQALNMEESLPSARKQVNRVHQRKPWKPKDKYKPKPAPDDKKEITCQFCGLDHKGPRSNCPASGKTCSACSKKGHFARMCKGKTIPKKPQRKPQSTAKYVQQEEQEYSSDSDFAFQLRADKTHASRCATVAVRIAGVKGKMEADSCSTANILDEHKLEKLQSSLKNKIQLKPTDTQLYAFAQQEPVPLIGCFEAEIESISTGKKTTAHFLVAKGTTKSRPLLSLDTSVELGLLHLTNATKEQEKPPGNYTSSSTDPAVTKLTSTYHDVFSGLGKHKQIKAKLIVNEDVHPIAHKPRRIPYNLAQKAAKEEQRLKELGIIEAVPDDQPTTWCTNPVIAPKPHNPEAIRFCSDMRVPNTAILRPVTEALTVEDIKFRLEGATVFSVLDMNEGYHQLELDESSRHLTTFYGAEGKMRYTRLNYGTISAQDIFDKAMDDTIAGLNGVLHIRDDFIVFGTGNTEHDEALESLLQRFRKCGLTFNPKKCKFRLSQVEFFGFVFSEDGIKPSPSKVDALKKMDPPKNVSEVRSLLGMAQYSARFIPNFAELTTPLRNLTHQGVKWRWSTTEQAAFDKLKDTLSSDTVLGYYETGLETKLQVDAGPNGLGLILMQKKPQGWKAVECASRSLTEVEKRYSQTDREALAIRWACERCYMYLIGSSFIIETDHQPLLPLFNNPHSRPPMRIERWLLYMQQFAYQLKYRPGKQNAADYLSRHTLPPTESDLKTCQARTQVVHSIITDTTPKAITLAEVQAATKKDKEFNKLIPIIQTGNRRACKSDPDLVKYAPVFQELSYLEGVVTRGHRIVIPKSLQEQVINICHEGHLGIVKTKQLLRSKVWFPGIDKNVERKIASCIPCQASTNSSQREPLKMSPTPKGPWLQASADFCGPFPTGETVLVVLDAYSKYPEIEIIPSTAAKDTLPALERIFATHGIPEVLKTDNGPPFQSHAFQSFAKEKVFSHRKITPLWPEADGHVEGFTRNLGKVSRTAHCQGKDCLSSWPITEQRPTQELGKAPTNCA